MYSPSFRENKPKTLVFNDRKWAFWASFRENWVYKFRHRSIMGTLENNWKYTHLVNTMTPTAKSRKESSGTELRKNSGTMSWAQLPPLRRRESSGTEDQRRRESSSAESIPSAKSRQNSGTEMGDRRREGSGTESTMSGSSSALSSWWSKPPSASSLSRSLL